MTITYQGIIIGKSMPFKKIAKGKNKGKYKSPTGKVMTKKQVKAYYAKR